MTILNIESSGENCSVALSSNGKTIATLETKTGLQHAEILAEYCQKLVKSNLSSFKNVDAVAISKGPGSYTGLRIGYSFAKGLCYSLNIPLIGIDTLYIIAYNCHRKNNHRFTHYIPMIDARRMEVYMSVYNADLQLITEPNAIILDKPSMLDLFIETKKNIVVTGNGSYKFQDIALKHNLQISFFDQLLSANLMSEIAQTYYHLNKFEDIAYSVPFYLKNFTATTPKKSYFKNL